MSGESTPAGARLATAEVGGGGLGLRGSSGMGDPEARAAVFLRPEIRPRILLAEDDPETRSLIAAVLRSEGYEVVEASDGAELVDLVEAAFWARRGRRGVPVSLVVSDVRMPEFSGIDVLWILRATSWEVPVILMGTWEDDPSRVEAGELGANAFLRKPLDLDALRRVVRATLRGALPARAGAVI
jgi:DNA-binding response OmpR family regulator